jgi:hypothetical protein
MNFPSPDITSLDITHQQYKNINASDSLIDNNIVERTGTWSAGTQRHEIPSRHFTTNLDNGSFFHSSFGVAKLIKSSILSQMRACQYKIMFSLEGNSHVQIGDSKHSKSKPGPGTVPNNFLKSKLIN